MDKQNHNKYDINYTKQRNVSICLASLFIFIINIILSSFILYYIKKTDFDTFFSDSSQLTPALQVILSSYVFVLFISVVITFAAYYTMKIDMRYELSILNNITLYYHNIKNIILFSLPLILTYVLFFEDINLHDPDIKQTSDITLLKQSPVLRTISINDLDMDSIARETNNNLYDNQIEFSPGTDEKFILDIFKKNKV